MNYHLFTLSFQRLASSLQIPVSAVSSLFSDGRFVAQLARQWAENLYPELEILPSSSNQKIFAIYGWQEVSLRILTPRSKLKFIDSRFFGTGRRCGEGRRLESHGRQQWWIVCDICEAPDIYMALIPDSMVRSVPEEGISRAGFYSRLRALTLPQKEKLPPAPGGSTSSDDDGPAEENSSSGSSSSTSPESP